MVGSNRKRDEKEREMEKTGEREGIVVNTSIQAK